LIGGDRTRLRQANFARRPRPPGGTPGAHRGADRAKSTVRVN